MKWLKPSLKQKTIFGYLVLFAFTILVVLFSEKQFSVVEHEVNHLTGEAANNAQVSDQIKFSILQMSAAVDQFIARDSLETNKAAQLSFEKTTLIINKSRNLVSKTQSKTLDSIDALRIQYIEGFNKVAQRFSELDRRKLEITNNGAAIQREIDSVYRKASDQGKLEEKLFDYSKQFVESRIWVARYFSDPDTSHLESAQGILGPLVFKMSQNLNTPIQNLSDEIDEYLVSLNRVVDLRAALERQVDKEIRPLTPQLVEVAGELASASWSQLEVAKNTVSNRFDRTERIIAGLVALAILLSVFLYMYIVRSVIRPFDRITDALGRASQNVDGTSDGISQISRDLSARAMEAASAVQETVASMAEMSTMITETSESTKKSLGLAKKVTERTEEGSRIMEKMVSAMESIHQANNQLQDMVAIINEISNKTTIINDIVFKTQLLAFNASIEAARAGQHGRGFAVVAEEVGNLAELSGTAANEIAELLNDSQKQVIEIVENTANRVTEGRDVSSTALNTFDEIAREVFTISSQIQSVNDATREQELGIQQTQKAMAKMDLHTQGSSVIADEASNAASHLMLQSVELNSIIARMQELVFGTNEKRAKSLKTDPAHRAENERQQVRGKTTITEVSEIEQNLDDLRDRILAKASVATGLVREKQTEKLSTKDEDSTDSCDSTI